MVVIIDQLPFCKSGDVKISQMYPCTPVTFSRTVFEGDNDCIDSHASWSKHQTVIICSQEAELLEQSVAVQVRVMVSKPQGLTVTLSTYVTRGSASQESTAVADPVLSGSVDSSTVN
jgi:hypothetical protein